MKSALSHCELYPSPCAPPLHGAKHKDAQPMIAKPALSAIKNFIMICFPRL
jgi:hypothetical protein